MMRLAPGGPERLLASWRAIIVLATIIAVAVFAFWVARDGFQAGGALGGLIIWAGLLAVLAAARRFGAR